MDKARRHFYGFCAVTLGAWETAAFLGRLPTITETLRPRRKLHPLIVAWTAGLAVHLCKDSTK
jgi:hypothetical protein